MLTDRKGNIVDLTVNKTNLDAVIDFNEKLGEKFPKFGILVVAYEAEKYLSNTINRIPGELKDCIEDIFIFDDFSIDKTFEVANILKNDGVWSNKIHAFKNPRNLGYGGNQKSGYNYAIERGIDYVIMLHGDGQYGPEYIPDLMLQVLGKDNEVVFASRMLNKKDAISGGMPLYKWLGNQILTKFENLVLDTNLSEFHSGYRMYSTSILKKIPFEQNTNDFHFDTQIIIQCRALGVNIVEVPIKTYYGDEVCHVNGIKYAIDICWAVLEYRLTSFEKRQVSC